jgi:hypothetical protein
LRATDGDVLEARAVIAGSHLKRDRCANLAIIAK